MQVVIAESYLVYGQYLFILRLENIVGYCQTASMTSSKPEGDVESISSIVLDTCVENFCAF